MVNLGALLTIAPRVAASVSTPSNELAPRAGNFSFQDWASGIKSDPNGAHLSPENAWEMYYGDSGGVNNAGDIVCNAIAGIHAPISDVIQCINNLAVNGTHDCQAPKGVSNSLCSEGFAMFAAVPTGSESVTLPCGEIAVFAGKMMDLCNRPDGTIQATGYPTDGYMLHITTHKRI